MDDKSVKKGKQIDNITEEEKKHFDDFIDIIVVLIEKYGNKILEKKEEKP